MGRSPAQAWSLPDPTDRERMQPQMQSLRSRHPGRRSPAGAQTRTVEGGDIGLWRTLRDRAGVRRICWDGGRRDAMITACDLADLLTDVARCGDRGRSPRGAQGCASVPGHGRSRVCPVGLDHYAQVPPPAETPGDGVSRGFDACGLKVCCSECCVVPGRDD